MLSCTRITWRERAAWHVHSPTLDFVVTETGCHLAALRLPEDDPAFLQHNPLWQPQWPAGDPASAAAAGTWGGGEHAVEAPLLASICGSNLCADRFGAPLPGDAPRPLHGEAGILPWALQRCSAASVAFAVALPTAGWALTRAFSVAPSGGGGGCLTVETTLLHPTAAAPLTVEICEHTTLGNAFLDGCVISASVGEVAHAMAEGEAEPAALPAAEALRVPAPSDPPCGSVVACKVVAGSSSGGGGGGYDAHWVATNAAMGRRLTARWRAVDFPWLCLWTEHCSRSHAPWNSRERTRGMEVATKPFPQPPPPSRAEAFLGVPTRLQHTPGAPLVRAVEFTWEKV